LAATVVAKIWKEPEPVGGGGTAEGSCVLLCFPSLGKTVLERV
jgi:hypothetical protein